jgi:hypothetical protein
MNRLAKIFVTFILTTFIATAAKADSALGLVFGHPTGISFRSDISTNYAFDVVAAWNIGKSRYLIMHADYLRVEPKFVGPTSYNTDLYYGVGGILSLPENDFTAALRLPVGIMRKFNDPKIELFGELAIAFTVVPKTDFDLVGGAGIRWWW